MGKKVGVLVVDDSLICRQLICDALSRDPELEVVGTCVNGREAVEKAKALSPSVITMDVDMPVMDGLTAIENIMADNPTPILVLTADPRNQAPELTCRALELGALALQVKPSLEAPAEAWNLAREVKLLASVKVIRHLRGLHRKQRPGASPVAGGGPSPEPSSHPPVGLVAIGSSTGGPQVVHRLLSELPDDFPAPITVVQHINLSFAESLAGWLAASSRLRVRLAKEGDRLLAGEVLIGPPGKHMLITGRGRVSVRGGEPRDGHIPSVTALMESAAQVYGRRAVGILLTGMGCDGADGMLAIRAAGGRTIAQSEESCVVFGMPGAAVAKKAVDQIVHGDDMSSALLRLVYGDRRELAR